MMEEPSLSELPDDLILKIFSLLPFFKESVATNLLKKRREDLMFDDNYKSHESLVKFTSFAYGSLSFNKSQIVDIRLSRGYSASDISFLLKLAVKRSVRKLRIRTFGKTLELPRCLSICVTLKSLVLYEVRIKAVPPWFRLPSLKTLHLLSVKFSGEESIASFLPVCPVLECLVVDRTKDNVMIFNIDTPSLRSLSIVNSIRKNPHVMEKHGFVINAPSLEKINFKDTFSNLLVFEHMPAVTEANIQVICGQSKKFIGSFTSIRQLSVCSLSSETPYPSGTIFPYLEHLELCTCSAGWANLLVCILKDAPTLRYLKLKSQHGADYNDPMNYWNKPTAVPECLSTHLEIMEWRQYEGTEEVMNVAAYILANARCLKTATFSTRCGDKHHSMLRELRSLKRGSDTCQLLFD
nr:PREDICTED: putative FBD-associated F-box protein At5g56560 [Raphanus sativus]